MRKIWILLVSISLLALSVPALAQDATAEAAAAVEPWACPKGFEGQQLNVFNWSIYIAEDTVSNFEKACGVKVVYDVYVSNEELIAKLRAGNPGYDVIVPTGYAIAIMIKEKLLQPLDLAKIPNFANISEGLKNPGYDPGNQHSVPYQWGTVGLAYNKTKVGKTLTSWKDLFDYKGNVAWLEDQRATLGVGLLMLGYDPNSTSADEIKKAKEYLVANSKNVVAIVQGNSKELLNRGEVDIAVDYNGNVFGLMAECAADKNCKTEWDYAIPSEGTNVWVDNLAVPVGARNPALAHVFINYILDPKVGADISNYVTYASPNQKAIDLKLINAAQLNDPRVYPPDEVRKKLFFAKDVPEAEQLYNDAWDELKIQLKVN